MIWLQIILSSGHSFLYTYTEHTGYRGWDLECQTRKG